MSNQASGLLSGHLRKIRIKTSLPYIKTPLLDVGCSNGPLADFFKPDEYTGIDIDNESLLKAQQIHPQHRFCRLENLKKEDTFACIVLLAVIEHIVDPQSFLQNIKKHLLPSGRIILTTPSPYFKEIYSWGSHMGIFSREAEEEHQDYYNFLAIRKISDQVGLIIREYKKFLLGANQLFILENTDAH